MKLFLEYFSSLVQSSNILPVFVLQVFSVLYNNLMLAKKNFFEAYRVLWALKFVETDLETDLEDQHLQIKYFTSINTFISGLKHLFCIGMQHIPSTQPTTAILLKPTVLHLVLSILV